MSYGRYLKNTKWFSIFRGLWTEDSIGDIPADALLGNSLLGRGLRTVKGASYLQRATNIFGEGITSVIKKRPGFTEVRGTTIGSGDAFTSFMDMGEIASTIFLMTVNASSVGHSLFQDSANPPAEITGGTDFTASDDNLISPVLFTDGTSPMAIFASRSRDVLQSIVAAPTRADFVVAGTALTSLKAKYLEVFGQRLLHANVDFDGTIHDDRLYWSAIRDGNLIDDPTLDFFSFETSLKDSIRGVHKLGDICVVGKINNIFTMVVTPDETEPFTIQEETAGRGKGPVSHQTMIEIDQKLFWLSQDNIVSIDNLFRLREWADAIKPTLRGLNQNRTEFAIAGLDSSRKLILFNVADGSDTTKDLTLGLNYQTGALYSWDLRRNTYGHRIVSGVPQLIGGGYIGKFYQELNGTSGALDDATAVIGADVITPKYWLNAYGTRQKIPYALVAIDPQGTETFTITFAIDDEDILTAGRTPTNAPYTVSGSQHKVIFVPLNVVAERIQLRIRNAVADEGILVKAIGLPGLALQPQTAGAA